MTQISPTNPHWPMMPAIIPPSSTLCINWEKVPESSSITSETTRTQAKRYPYPRGVGERTMKNDTYIYIYIYRDSLVKSPQWEPSIPLQRALNQTIPIYIYVTVCIYFWGGFTNNNMGSIDWWCRERGKNNFWTGLGKTICQHVPGMIFQKWEVKQWNPPLLEVNPPVGAFWYLQ